MDLEPNTPPAQPQWNAAPPTPPAKSKFPMWAILLIGVGVCGCGCVPLLGAILFPVFAQAKLAAKTTASLSNMKQITTSWLLYAADSDDRAMPKEDWNANLDPYMKNPGMLEDPLLKADGERLGYGYNPLLSKFELGEVEDPAKQVAFGLTAKPGKDALLSADSLRATTNNGDKTLLSFSNGSSRKMEMSQTGSLNWKPKQTKGK